VLYGSASAVNQIIHAMSIAGYARDRYFIWSAHYTFHSHICSPSGCGYPQADATQWTDKSGGKNLDESLCSDAFFQVRPVPTPPIPEDTMAITSFVNHDGRAEIVVQLSSGEVKNIAQQKPGGEWWKDDKGNYTWLTKGNPGK